MHEAQSLINHVALVLDGSSSMEGHEAKVIEVADAQIQHLALRSEQMGQETRISVYLFADDVKCLIFDMDVMRLPSIKHLYKVYGNTALIEATMKSQADLDTTSRIYGDHAFLTFVITDGLNNRFGRYNADSMATYLRSMKNGWSLGFLVPQADRYGRNDGLIAMKRLNVPDDMVQTWDTADVDGFVGAGKSVTAAADSFMQTRASGQSVLRSAFSTGTDVLNTQTVKAAALTPMPFADFTVAWNRTANKMEMKDFIEFNGMKYRHGKHFYELTNATRSKVQPQKQIVVRNRKTDEAFTDADPGSPRVRDLIGLSHTDPASVRADANKEFVVFVQSTATNRHVRPGMAVLTLNPASA